MRKRKTVRQLSNFDLVIVQGCGHAIAEHLPRAFLHGFLPPKGFAVQPVVVQRDRRDSQFVPAKFFFWCLQYGRISFKCHSSQMEQNLSSISRVHSSQGQPSRISSTHWPAAPR